MMRAPRLEGRVEAADLVRVEAFTKAWRAFYGGTGADALRALLRLGLDAAARPGMHDERWCDLADRLDRVEALLDAVGRAVSANPALAAWLLAHAPGATEAGVAPEALPASLEALLEADWDERRRVRGLPRTRPSARRERPPALGVAGAPARPEPRRRLIATTVRLSPDAFDRAAAHARRVELSRQAALADLVQRGLDSAEADAARDQITVLLDTARRIEAQLDAIGPLATSPALVVAHLWRRIAGQSEEWEHVLPREIEAVAEATWHDLQHGPPQEVPAELQVEPTDEGEGTG